MLVFSFSVLDKWFLVLRGCKYYINSLVAPPKLMFTDVLLLNALVDFLCSQIVLSIFSHDYFQMAHPVLSQRFVQYQFKSAIQKCNLFWVYWWFREQFIPSINCYRWESSNRSCIAANLPYDLSSTKRQKNV